MGGAGITARSVQVSIALLSGTSFSWYWRRHSHCHSWLWFKWTRPLSTVRGYFACCQVISATLHHRTFVHIILLTALKPQRSHMFVVCLTLNGTMSQNINSALGWWNNQQTEDKQKGPFGPGLPLPSTYEQWHRWLVSCSPALKLGCSIIRCICLSVTKTDQHLQTALEVSAETGDWAYKPSESAGMSSQHLHMFVI